MLKTYLGIYLIALNAQIIWGEWLIPMNLNIFWDIEKDREAWCAAVHEVTKSRSWLSDWTKTVTKSSQNNFISTLCQQGLILDIFREDKLFIMSNKFDGNMNY